MNLLPLQEKRVIIVEYRKRLAVVGLMFLAVLICVALIPLASVYMASNYQIMNLKKEVVLADKANTEEGVVENTGIIRDANGKLDLLGMTSADDLGYSLAEILSSIATTDKVRLISWSYEQVEMKNGGARETGYRIILGGIADDRDSLQSFVKVLQSDKRFKSTELPISSLIESKDIDFLITVMVNKK